MDELITTNASRPAVFCAACHKEVTTDDVFCEGCGYPLKGTEQEQSIFLSNRGLKEIDLDEAHRKINRAKKTLYWVAGATAIFGVITAAANPPGIRNTLLVTNLVLALIYACLGFWSQRKPLTAIICGFSLYILVIVLNAFADPLTIIRGVVVKIVFIGYFIHGIKSALEAEKLEKELNID